MRQVYVIGINDGQLIAKRKHMQFFLHLIVVRGNADISVSSDDYIVAH
jgi:hypothetical protein